MWTTDFTATTTASPGQVWAALEALHSGTALGPNSDSFELHGPFVAGTTLTVTPQGQDPMESTIIDLEPGRVYADQTRFSDLVLTFRHQFTPALAGGTQVTHTLEITARVPMRSVRSWARRPAATSRWRWQNSLPPASSSEAIG